jgi:hypothetical protein
LTTAIFKGKKKEKNNETCKKTQGYNRKGGIQTCSKIIVIYFDLTFFVVYYSIYYISFYLNI